MGINEKALSRFINFFNLKAVRYILVILLGAACLLLIFYIQYPVQSFLLNSQFFYKINSLIIQALIYGLIASLMQRTSTFAVSLLAPDICIGGFLSGAALGIAEAVSYSSAYVMSYGFKFFISFEFLVRISKVLFHASSTGIISFGLKEKKFGYYYIPIILIDTILNSLSVFANISAKNQKNVTLISIIVTVLLFIYFLFLANIVRFNTEKKGETKKISSNRENERIKKLVEKRKMEGKK